MNETGALSIPVTPLDEPFKRGELQFRRMVFDRPGLHQLVWIAGGVLGAVTFTVMEIEPAAPALSPLSCQWINGKQWMGQDLGRHTPRPLYDYDDEPFGPCIFLEGLPCYYDGSSLGAMDLLRDAVEADSEEVIWARLTACYNAWFKEDDTDAE